MTPRTPIHSPLDSQLVAYRNAQTPEGALPAEVRKWVEEAVLVGTEVYEMLARAHRLGDGLDQLRRRSGVEAVEAMRRLREWLTATRDLVLRVVAQVEQQEGYNAVSNTQHLRTYAARAEGLLKEWDGTLTQANVAWRDTELTPEEGEAVAELMRSGGAKAKFKRPPLSPPR